MLQALLQTVVAVAAVAVLVAAFLVKRLAREPAVGVDVAFRVELSVWRLLVGKVLGSSFQVRGFPGALVNYKASATAPDDVVIRMTLAGICASDVTLLTGSSNSLYGAGTLVPLVPTSHLGHENVGVVIDGPAAWRGKRK